MKSHLFTALISLSIGIGIGWVALGGAQQSPIATKPESSRSSRPRNVQISSSPSLTLSRIRDVTMPLSKSELPSAVIRLAMQGGIRGINQGDATRLKSLIKSWYADDPDGFLAWLDTLPDSPDRQFFFEQVLPDLASKDIRQAVDLLDRYSCTDSTEIQIPYDLFDRALAEDPELLGRAIVATACKNNTSSGWNVNFPVGFDYSGFMQQLKGSLQELDASRDKNELPARLGAYPANLLQSWISEDPQAAFDWCLTTEGETWKNQAPGQYSLQSFFGDYARVADAESLGQFTAEYYSKAENPAAAVSEVWTALATRPDSVTIDSFLEQASPDTPANTLIEQLLTTTANRSGGSSDVLRRELLSKLSPAERATFLQQPEVQSRIPSATRLDWERAGLIPPRP
ncbi:hypothetical protein JIN85_05215 [Luteolibacter pohnpeiensis]|uniref:Uncharacterized protein n=1 Tax=Luteolibacter pohnpeiensis TaxID=454153 RepID=A0A934S8U2_9BACT|nr:hypothetical protein [Luteolibacter pohnpeiensis]MBK1881802.1 hypothetical protein [Luteolibacter pohnpeiensis]